MAEIKTHSPFTIQMFEASYDNFNQATLSTIIKDYARNTPGVVRSNHNGYQSPPTLHTNPDLNELTTFIAETADVLIKNMGVTNYTNLIITDMWANINYGLNTHNQVHTHYGILSGVFYVQAPEGSGNLNILNPGMNCLWPGHYKANSRNQYNAEAVMIKPKEGTLFMWPSYIPHSVDCNDVDVDRISIAFNIDVE